MRCTECSTVVKPVVAIDIDGTLGDYHGHFLRFAGEYLGIKPSLQYNGEVGFKEWFCSTHGLDHRTWHDIKLAYRQGGMKRSMPAYPLAHRPAETARNTGAEVWLTTTRPYLRLDGIDPDTRFWLARHSIQYDGLLYQDDKYHALAERIDPGRVVAVLDDLPEQYDEAAELFGLEIPMLRRQQYNMNVIRANVVRQLDTASIHIYSRIIRWRSQHGTN